VRSQVFHRALAQLRARRAQFGRRPLCSLDADRAPAFAGFVFPLCYRCTGLCVGATLGVLVAWHSCPSVPAPAVIALMVGMPCDVVTQGLGLRRSNNWLRLTTGLMFGAGLNMIRFA